LLVRASSPLVGEWFRLCGHERASSPLVGEWFRLCGHERASSPLVGEWFRLCGQQAGTSEDGDPRRLSSGDSGWMAEMWITPISLKHSPTSGED